MPQLDRVFAALGDPTRRAIVARLSEGETALSEIAAQFPISQVAVSKHVRVLGSAGLVEINKRGRTRYCRLNAAPMQQAASWLGAYESFWQSQFKALADYVEGQPE